MAVAAVVRRVCLAAQILLLLGNSPVSAMLERYLFSAAEVHEFGARCLDGSPSGFFYEKGAQSKKWVLYLEGGGICETQEACEERSHTNLGSSTKWQASFTGSGLLSSNASEAGAFSDWSHIFIPYCGGDVHCGQTWVPNEWNLYFAGHLTIVAVMEKLILAGNFISATDILLSGESAGGIGAFEHVDFFASRFPNAHVRGSPQGGYFYAGTPQSYAQFVGNQTPPARTSALYDLYNASVNQACRKENPSHPYLCGPANVGFLLKYIQTPVFVAENKFDSNQIFGQMKCPHEKTAEVTKYVEYYGANMWSSVRERVIGSPLGHGLYFPACLLHTGNLHSPFDTRAISGVTYGQSLADWYLGAKAYSHILYENSTVPDC